MTGLQSTIGAAYAPALERMKAMLDRIENKRIDAAARTHPAAVRATIDRTGTPPTAPTWERRDTPLLKAIRSHGDNGREWSILHRHKLKIDRKPGEAIDLDDERSRILFSMPAHSSPLWALEDHDPGNIRHAGQIRRPRAA